MKTTVLCVWSIGLLILGGCAQSITTLPMSTVPAAPREVPIETTVPDPFDTVWDRLVSRLATSFFVINNIEKESRLINASISSPTPEEFVDCGTSTRRFVEGPVTREYVYPIASSSQYRAGEMAGWANNQPVIADVTRTANLDGRVNIYVAPDGPDATLVTANARYVLTIQVTGTYEAQNAFGRTVSRGNLPAYPATVVSFNSAETREFDFGTPEAPLLLPCVSTGHLESSILDLAR